MVYPASGDLRAVEKVRLLTGPRGDPPFAHHQRRPAGQVHPPGRYDEHEPFIASDVRRAEHPVHALEFDQGIAVQPGHQLGAAQCESGHRSTPEQPFASVADNTAFDQLHQRVGERGGVNAQVLLASQMLGQRFEEWADAPCQTGAVLDHRCHAGGDPVEDVVLGPAVEIDRRFGGLHQQVELVDGDEGVAVGEGYFVADLSDHQIGFFHGPTGHIHSHAEAAVARLVGRCNLNEGHVYWDLAGSDQPGDGRKARWDQIDVSGCDGLGRNPSGEEGLQAILA